MDGFEFATAGKIIFRSGAVLDLPELAKKWGEHVMLIFGSKPERHKAIQDSLGKAGFSVMVKSVSEEPSVQCVLEIVEAIRQQNSNVVIGIGGGSVIDAGKAAAILANNPGDIMDYLEVVGAGKTLPQISLPYIAVPTTAGTGAEVTKNAVITVPERGVKVSLRSPYMFPTLAIVDPNLTMGCSEATTQSCAFDALCHLAEAFVSKKATPLTDGFCRTGLSKIGAPLVDVWEDPGAKNERQVLSMCSLLGGLALANGGLGAVHGFAGVIGGMYHAAHGAICGALLASVFAMNITIAQDRPKDPTAVETLGRMRELARLFSGNAVATPDQFVSDINTIRKKQSAPGLEALGVKREDFPDIIEKSSHASSMKGNPFILTTEQLLTVLDKAF